LMESHCLPILLYATECVDLKASQIKELNSWWNSVYRKIFDYNKWESVKELIYRLNRLDTARIINLRQLSFIKRMSPMPSLNNSFTSVLNYFLHSGRFVTILNVYGCKFTWTVNKIKAMMHLSLEQVITNKSN